MTILVGDCRQLMPEHAPFDMILADPPYGDTALKWDRRVEAWHRLSVQCLKPTGSLWVFGSLRYFMADTPRFEDAGLKYAQEIVWRKPNGSGMAADRFKRVHEHVVQFYRRDAKWSDIYNDVQRVPALHKSKSVRRQRPDRVGHAGRIGAHEYHDDGMRIMKSVIDAKSPRGGIHPTEKPIGLLEVLIRTSCPPGGTIGDFFAGSGAAGEAATMIGRVYVGCEIDPLMASRAQARLAALFPFFDQPGDER
ncbi:site-specific DNA-methyltransferase [Sphingobium soli]|uniref:Methyltransferase n=1 Tax=Sphingobium soli TaxID=1591116 RepID=A0ABS8H1C2_9SPHN|nr:site-specific DNA-methyltransferase [Sphingobium soli]MCC4232306.1 site-specific DNA-methyltransferase [Sphingobium soli]